jgi:predicted nucleotidyltransferase
MPTSCPRFFSDLRYAGVSAVIADYSSNFPLTRIRVASIIKHMIEFSQIKAVGNQIAEHFHPQRIILFGSYADGHPTEDSDVDLLVIMPIKKSSVDQSVEIRMAIRPPFPVDLLVRSAEKVEERLKLGDSFMRSILQKGKVLYEAHHP